MKFWEEHKEQQDKFAIIAIHNPDQRADTFEKLDKLLEEKGIIKKWGQNLPFTVVLDNTKTSTTNYGVQAYPTTVLIDPEGNVVKGGSEAILKQKLEAAK